MQHDSVTYNGWKMIASHKDDMIKLSNVASELFCCQYIYIFVHLEAVPCKFKGKESIYTKRSDPCREFKTQCSLKHHDG